MLMETQHSLGAPGFRVSQGAGGPWCLCLPGGKAPGWALLNSTSGQLVACQGSWLRLLVPMPTWGDREYEDPRGLGSRAQGLPWLLTLLTGQVAAWAS